MDNCKFISLKSGFYKVRKVFLILFLYIIICKIIVSVFKDFKFNIVINIIYECEVNSLALLLLAFVNLLTYVRHTV